MPFRRLVDTYLSVGCLHRTVLKRELNKTGVYRSQHQLLMYISDNPNASQKICITEKGQKVVANSIRYFKAMEEKMFDGFSPEDLSCLENYLLRIKKNLSSLLPEAEREEEE